MLAAGALAFAAAAVVSTAGSALADPGPPGIVWDHTYKATGVVVYVEEHGDIVSVCDTAANGHRAEADVEDDGVGLRYTLSVTAGKGSCKTAQASDGHDMGEGDLIGIAYGGNGKYPAAVSTFVNDH